MGNPFVSASDGGPCLSCGHCQGFHTDPSRYPKHPAALCAREGGTRVWYGGILTGCRYWVPVVPESRERPG